MAEAQIEAALKEHLNESKQAFKQRNLIRKGFKYGYTYDPSSPGCPPFSIKKKGRCVIARPGRNTLCPVGYKPSKRGACKPLTPWQLDRLPDPATGECKPGFTYDKDLGMCVLDVDYVPACPTGYVRNTSTNRCIKDLTYCPPGMLSREEAKEREMKVSGKRHCYKNPDLRCKPGKILAERTHNGVKKERCVVPTQSDLIKINGCPLGTYLYQKKSGKLGCKLIKTRKDVSYALDNSINDDYLYYDSDPRKRIYEMYSDADDPYKTRAHAVFRPAIVRRNEEITFNPAAILTKAKLKRARQTEKVEKRTARTEKKAAQAKAAQAKAARAAKPKKTAKKSIPISKAKTAEVLAGLN